jgi:predicted transcriptional regulator
MTKLLEQAIEAARQLSPEEQDEIARTIFEIVRETSDEVYVLSEEERAAIDVARAQVARGEFASEEDIEAVFKKYAS